MFRLSFACLWLWACAAPAAVLTIGNMSNQAMRLKLSHPGQMAEQDVTLQPGEHRLFRVGKTPVIAYEAEGKTIRFQLDPYAAYVFAPSGNTVGLQGIELAGVMPKLNEIPDKPPEEGVYPLRIKIYGGDGDIRNLPSWEKAFKERFKSASEILEKQCQVRLEVVAAEVWTSDENARTPAELLKDFEAKAPASREYLSVGFTSRTLLPRGQELAKSPEHLLQAGCLRGPSGRHIILREMITRNESARLEMLIHEVAHHLGAVHSPDRGTSLRAGILDNRSDRAEVRIGLDPLNLLAVGIWLDEFRTGTVTGPADLSPLARERLKIVYKTLQNVLPDDTLANAFIAVLDQKEKAKPGEVFNLNLKQMANATAPGVGGSAPGQNLKIPSQPGPERIKVPVAPEPIEVMPNVAPVVAATPSTARDQSIRQVVRALTTRARLHRDQSRDTRLRSDALTADYLQTAAVIAWQMPEAHRREAFLIGIGIGLDDSKTLRDNPLPKVREVCRGVESDTEYAERVAFLGTPTMRYRRDLCQHFVVSAALAELLGPQEAESIGMTKELLDSKRTSGFSFADLCADYAGVALAVRLKAQPNLLDQLRGGVRVPELLPSVADLPEGITLKRFLAEYGAPDDPRFVKATNDIRQRIQALNEVKK